MTRHYLVKSEPYKYSFAQLLRDGQTAWDGVRNFEARNNLRAMAPGDLLLFYHSNEGKEVVMTRSGSPSRFREMLRGLATAA